MNKKQREVLLRAMESIASIEGITDADDACNRVARRMIAEVLGLPLDTVPLLMERIPRRPMYYDSEEND